VVSGLIVSAPLSLIGLAILRGLQPVKNGDGLGKRGLDGMIGKETERSSAMKRYFDQFCSIVFGNSSRECESTLLRNMPMTGSGSADTVRV